MQYKHVFWCPFRHTSVNRVFFVPFYIILPKFLSQKKFKRTAHLCVIPLRKKQTSLFSLCKDLFLICDGVPEAVLPGPFPRTTVLGAGHSKPSIGRRRVCRLRVLREIYIDRKTFVFQTPLFSLSK